ncbi:uncharacterized protein LOC108810216 isoform X1 [Raphanus sativus]|uniref:Uncharacterized protein LOC108810216 isoform X1 n=1 Tax=Raphanus sativus TaxID=3726 RepID=A0A9W3C9L4_RAPSA|nr:uncharacterized protein LOC108810216 isoform X1 [Raphanus sativus]XP_056848175.1 uncharacterized protein LOC108810216 isoform X1 [Raphanus sativus]
MNVKLGGELMWMDFIMVDVNVNSNLFMNSDSVSGFFAGFVIHRTSSCVAEVNLMFCFVPVLSSLWANHQKVREKPLLSVLVFFHAARNIVLLAVPALFFTVLLL